MTYSIYATPDDLTRQEKNVTPSLEQCLVVGEIINNWCNRQTLYRHYGVHYFSFEALFAKAYLPIHTFESVEVSYDEGRKWETLKYRSEVVNSQDLLENAILDLAGWVYAGELRFRIRGRFGWGRLRAFQTVYEENRDSSEAFPGMTITALDEDADDKGLYYIQSVEKDSGGNIASVSTVHLVTGEEGEVALASFGDYNMVRAPLAARSVALQMTNRLSLSETSAANAVGVGQVWEFSRFQVGMLTKYRKRF